jgi:ABC-2 type transport system permease protein
MTSSLSHVTVGSNIRVVLAIAKRDVITFFRYPMNALFGVIEPIAWLTPIYFLGQSFAGPGGNSGFAGYTGTADYMSFILIGMVLSSYIGAIFWGMGFGLKSEMDAGVLESNWMTPVSRLLFLLGKTIANLGMTTFNSAMTLLIAWMVFGFQVSGNVLLAVLILVPMLIALYGFGVGFASVVLLMKDANTLVDVSNFLISILSGSQFPVNVLPRGLLVLSLALPMTYGFDAIRGILLNGETLVPLAYAVGILLVFMVVMVPIGYAVFQRVERRCRVEGTIGMH